MKRPLKWWEWILAAVLAAILLFTLFGCGHRGSLPAGNAPGVHGGPAGVLHYLAIGATALAGTCLIACAFLAWFYPDKLKVAKLAIACVTIIIGSQITYWLGSHLVLASVLALLALACGAGVWALVHRRALERKTGIDFNRDGKVG